MRIAVFAPYFYPHKGGLEQYCWEIADRLTKFGHDVSVVTSKIGDEPGKEKQEFPIIRLDTWNLLGGTFPIPKPSKRNRKLISELFGKDLDCLTTATRFFPLSLLGLFWAKKNQVRSFHFEMGSCHPKLRNSLVQFVAFLYDQTFGRIVFLLADHHLAVSEAAADFSKKLGGKNIRVIYNSVDTDFFNGPNRKFQTDKLNIAFCGRLIEAKGAQDLIAAFRAIKNNRLSLQIIGQGNYEDALKAMAGGDKRIVFLGRVSREKLRDVLRNASIFVNPSYSEGLPTSVLEAGACGIPVIATDVGGTCEIIEHGKGGFLIKPGDREMLKKDMETLINDQALRGEISNNIYKKITGKFSWNDNVLKLIEILNEK